MLIDDLKKENMAALKAHDVNIRSVLSTVINKYMILVSSDRELEVKDEDVILLINKTLKELYEEKEGNIKAGRDENVKNLDRQIDYIKKYLPTLMSVEEIKEIILTLADRSVPVVMKHFKENYSGKCDLGVVSKVLRSLN